METGIGLFRDFVAAALGLLLLFGISVTQEQTGAILLLVTTGAALGSFAYNRWRESKKPPAA